MVDNTDKNKSVVSYFCILILYLLSIYKLTAVNRN